MSQVIKKPGIHKLLFQPGDRRYTLAIPESYRENIPMPFILALHWGGKVIPYTGMFVVMELVMPALYELGAIILAPDRTTEDWANPQAETDLLEFLDFVEENFKIDRTKTLITGFSMGGVGAWYMGSRHQNRFAAVLPMSAPPHPEALKARWDIPIHVIHSKSDKHFEISKVVEPLVGLKDKGVSVKLDILDDVGHYDTIKFVQPLRDAVPWIKEVWG